MWHYKTCPNVLSKMSDEKLFRLYAILSKCVEDNNKAHKKLEKRNG